MFVYIVVGRGSTIVKGACFFFALTIDSFQRATNPNALRALDGVGSASDSFPCKATAQLIYLRPSKDSDNDVFPFRSSVCVCVCVFVCVAIETACSRGGEGAP